VTTIPTIGTFSVFLLRVFTYGFFSSHFFVFYYFALKLGSSVRRETAKALVHSFSRLAFDFERPKTTKDVEGASQKKNFIYFYYLAFNITTHHVLTETLKTMIQVSTSKRSNTRTFRSRCGMSEDKTKFVRCGDTTSKTRKAWSSSWIVTIATVFPRREMNFTACWTKTNSATRCCWSLRTSKICRTRWLRLKLRTNSDYTRWDKDTGSFNLRARLRAKACTKVWTGFRRTLQTTNRKTERVGKRESGKERERERKWGVENERKRVGEIERERKPSYQNLKRKKAVFSNNKILIVCLEREREKERM